ncbi:MAG: DUF4012 domain-containing protein [Patescibacteria group bacterium]
MSDERKIKNDFWNNRSSHGDSFGVFVEKDLTLPDDKVLENTEGFSENLSRAGLKHKSKYAAKLALEKSREIQKKIEQKSKKERKKLSLKKFGNGILSVAAFLISPFILFKKQLAVSFLLILFITAAIQSSKAKAELNRNSEEAKNHINASFEDMNNGDIAGAVLEANKAKENIGKLKLLSQAWGQDIQYLSFIPSKPSKLVAYEKFLDSAYVILNSISSLNQEAKSVFSNRAVASGESVSSIDLLVFSKAFSEGLDKMEKNLLISSANLSSASASLPDDLKTSLDDASEIVKNTTESIATLRGFLNDGFPWIAGEESERNFLIVFQNNTEMRGSGGFIGSFASARIDKGKFSALDFEANIYKLDKVFTAKETVKPPEELAYLSNGKWAMRDSNFALDFPESAGKMLEFYGKETGKEADGAIVLDTTLFTDLLKVTGPIEMPEYGKTVTADNFVKEIQYEVEVGYFQRENGAVENEPKKILADMMPKFMDRLSSAMVDEKQSVEVMGAIYSALKKKHLLFNFQNQSVQETVLKLNYGGKIEHKFSDYLYVANTNIGGKKSSLNIKETINHKVAINNDGTLDEVVDLTRKHNGTGEWPDGDNINLVRILVPDQSTITDMKSTGGNFWPNGLERQKISPVYKIGTEAGKTKVSFWQNTSVGGETKSITSYKSNYRVDLAGGGFSYWLYLQKQPGNTGDDYRLDITYPKGYEPTNVKNYDFINRKILIKKILDSDEEIIVRFRKI